MTNPYRALCAELVDELEDWIAYGDALAIEDNLVDRARAALAQPEPEGPTDEEVDAWADQQGFIRGHGDHPCGFWIDDGDAGTLARAALARWGRPTPQPVAVSERLPVPEDCDEQGRCWWFDDDDEKWCLDTPYMGARLLCWTHWLPANALPTPRPR